MKKIILILTLAPLSLFAQTYTIDNWLHGKDCATVLTFDDWSPAHWTIAVPDLVNRDLVGTFFITTDHIWTPSHLDQAYNNGMELANHTVSHPSLTSINATDLENEIEDCKDVLDGAYSNQNTHTLAYPLGNYNQNVIDQVSQRHIAARIVNYTDDDWDYSFPDTDADYFKIPTIASGIFNNDLPYFIDELKWAQKGGGLYTIMYHSIYDYTNKIGDTWYDVISRADFQAQLDYLVSVEDDVWVTTFSNAVRYHKEHKTAKLNLISDDDYVATYQLTDDLADNDIYNQPLTVRLEIPEGDNYFSVTQNDVEIGLTIENGIAIFDAIPDGGDIKFNKTVSAVNDLTDSEYIRIYPTTSTGVINIELSNNNTLIHKEVFSVSGKSLLQESTSASSIDLTSIPTGSYLLMVQTSSGISTHRVIKK